MSVLKSTLASLQAAAAGGGEKKRGRPPSKEKKPAVEKGPAPEGAPDASYYRMTDEPDSSLCMGRRLTGEDKNWTPAVFHETQCGKKPVQDGLCSTCCSKREKEMEAGKFKNWNGRIDEDPANDDMLKHSVHMLGTAWAEKCTWNPGKNSAETSPVAAKEAKDAKAAAKEAEKAAAKAAKAAAKEVKAAEKAAAKEAKAAEKAAAKEDKAKEGGAKEKTKEKTKTKDKEKAKTTDQPAGSSVASTEEAVADGDFNMILIDGELRVTKNGNVYELDELTQTPGDYLGRLVGTKEAPVIDGDADEVVESDAE